MSDPVLVEVMRGDHVESVHRGVIAVCDFDLKPVLGIGDVDQPVFPRSAVKAIQALPLLETGAAAAFGFGDRELALACASHSGEPIHVEQASAMLAAAGLAELALECGSHWPSSHDAALDLARAGRTPSQLHNNCSGKHAGFLAVCRQCGLDHHGYVAAGHPLQDMVRSTMEEVVGVPHDASNRAVDGCSIPTYAVPLASLAAGFARMGGGRGLGELRARSARRLLEASMRHPFLVAGTGRADTRMMEAAPGRIFVKTGAEGVYCGVVPERGLAFAVKCADGASRGAEAVVAGLLERLLLADRDLAPRLAELARPTIRSRRGAAVGLLRPTPMVADLVL